MRAKIETQVMIIVVASMLLQALVVVSITWAEDVVGLGAMVIYYLGSVLIACVLCIMIVQCKDRIVDAAYDKFNEEMFELHNQNKQKPGEENERQN